MSSKNSEKLNKDSFDFIGKLGDGAYGKVYLVRKKNTFKQYALKCVEKMHIIKHDKVESVHRERDILQTIKHPNIVSLECTFQDNETLYFLLEYVSNGSLSQLLKLISKSANELIRFLEPLPIELARFYTAEIVSALEYLHTSKIGHRDLKPENILLDQKYHIKIVRSLFLNLKWL